MNRARATSTRGGRRGAASATDSQRRAASDDAQNSQIAATEPVGSEDATPSPSTATRRATSRSLRSTSGRFRPRAVRRDESERDSLARQEEKKAQERAAEERRARGRSRFRSKRSRGDSMGSRGGWGRGTSTATGPFGGGFAGPSGGSGGWLGGGSGGGSGGGFRTAGPRRVKMEGKDFGPGDESRIQEARINADKLHVLTPQEELDSEDEAMMAALGNRASSVLPMGIYRREHKETGVIVATTAELEAAERAEEEEEEEEDSLWIDGDGSRRLPEQQEEHGVWHVREKCKAPATKASGEDGMDIDEKTEAPRSQEEKRGKREKAKDEEQAIIQADLKLLASELGGMRVTDSEGKTRAPADKDGRLYLFQFPPRLPPLGQATAAKVKKEASEDVAMADATAVDLTQDDGASSSTATAAESSSDERAAPLDGAADGFRSQLLAQGGLIGQLKVRASGRVQLDWAGGMTLEMSPAAGMNFLTTAMIVEERDDKPSGTSGAGVAGEGIGMGKIMGRFVLAPVWSDEDEWTVAPADLVVPDE
ncbi:hypothetical protein CDD81_5827 [Ophiocordyceps australis]|uniref:Uncharacterized protein n=1 Tax=Ophiocordyceps australis TaxID=1399860 RepID=A0A2C5XI36_9HYPO|nr:hypothetical protein CDD81_5827 [Ophiocordyceps australis]